MLSHLRPYAVTFEYSAIVMAEDPEQAERVARRAQSEILDDLLAGDVAVSTRKAITSESELSLHGYNGDCLPYGGDGRMTLRQIIANLPATAIVRDTRTIDMFAGLEETPESK